MRRAQHPGAGSPADVIFENEIACVEISLRSDPDVIADPRRAVKAPLNIGLGANEDAVADFERLQVFETHSTANLHAVAEFPRDCPPERPAHEGVEFAIA